MQPYNTDYDHMVENTEGDERPLTPEQLSKTWFERVNDRALENAFYEDHHELW